MNRNSIAPSPSHECNMVQSANNASPKRFASSLFMRKSALLFMLALLLALILAPMASAADLSAYQWTLIGDYLELGMPAKAPTNGADYTFNGTTLTITGSTSYAIRGSTNSFAVNITGAATVTLDHVQIMAQTLSQPAIRISNPNVRIELQSYAYLNGGADCAGMQVENTAGVTISGNGELDTRGGPGGAGIGSGSGGACGSIHIQDARCILAWGGEYADGAGAGIGGGSGSIAAPANISISNSIVYARAGRGFGPVSAYSPAAIGGGASKTADGERWTGSPTNSVVDTMEGTTSAHIAVTTIYGVIETTDDFPHGNILRITAGSTLTVSAGQERSFEEIFVEAGATLNNAGSITVETLVDNLGTINNTGTFALLPGEPGATYNDNSGVGTMTGNFATQITFSLSQDESAQTNGMLVTFPYPIANLPFEKIQVNDDKFGLRQVSCEKIGDGAKWFIGVKGEFPSGGKEHTLYIDPINNTIFVGDATNPITLMQKGKTPKLTLEVTERTESTATIRLTSDVTGQYYFEPDYEGDSLYISPTDVGTPITANIPVDITLIDREVDRTYFYNFAVWAGDTSNRGNRSDDINLMVPTLANFGRIYGPKITNMEITSRNQTEATIAFNSDGAGAMYYLLLGAGVAPPTEAAVKASPTLINITEGANTHTIPTETANHYMMHYLVRDNNDHWNDMTQLFISQAPTGGIIEDGDGNYEAWGSFTLDRNINLTTGKTFTVRQDAQLNIVDSFDFNISGTLINNGSLSIYNRSLTLPVGSALHNNGHFFLDNSEMSNSGTIRNVNGAQIVIYAASKLENNGDIESAGGVFAQDNSQLHNKKSLVVQSDGVLNVDPSSTLTNPSSADMQIEVLSHFIIESPFTNQGKLKIAGQAIVSENASLTNEDPGELSILSSGVMSVRGKLINNATTTPFKVEDRGVLDVFPPGTFKNDKTVDNYGTINVPLAYLTGSGKIIDHRTLIVHQIDTSNILQFKFNKPVDALNAGSIGLALNPTGNYTTSQLTPIPLTNDWQVTIADAIAAGDELTITINDYSPIPEVPRTYHFNYADSFSGTIVLSANDVDQTPPMLYNGTASRNSDGSVHVSFEASEEGFYAWALGSAPTTPISDGVEMYPFNYFDIPRETVLDSAATLHVIAKDGSGNEMTQAYPISIPAYDPPVVTWQLLDRPSADRVELSVNSSKTGQLYIIQATTKPTDWLLASPISSANCYAGVDSKTIVNYNTVTGGSLWLAVISVDLGQVSSLVEVPIVPFSPPSITDINYASRQQGSVSVTFTTSAETGQYIYALTASGEATPPTMTDFRTSSSFESFGAIFSPVGITAQATKVWVALKDGNMQMSAPVGVDIPAFITPTINNASVTARATTTASITLTTNVAGKLYHAVTEASVSLAPVPGTDYTDVDATIGEQTIPLTGIDAAAKKVWLYLEDGSGNTTPVMSVLIEETDTLRANPDGSKTVMGNFVLSANTTIGSALYIPDGATLTIGGGITLTISDTGSIEGAGTLTVNGTIENHGTITIEPAAINGSGTIEEDASFSAVQVGGVSGTATTTGIQLTFTPSISGITANDITLDVGTKGNLTGSAPSYTIGIDSFSEGPVEVTVDNISVGTAPTRTYKFTPTSVQVQVYTDTTPPTISGLSASRNAGNTTGTATFTASEAGTYDALVLAASDTAPTNAAELIANPSAITGSFTAFGSISLTGLDPDEADLVLYVVLKDSAGNQQTTVSSVTIPMYTGGGSGGAPVPEPEPEESEPPLPGTIPQAKMDGLLTLNSIFAQKGKLLTIPVTGLETLDTDGKDLNTSWSTDAAEGVLTLSSTGQIQALQTGKALDVTIVSGEFTATTRIYTVKNATPVNSASISPSGSMKLHAGAPLRIVPSWKPYNATNVIPKYTSSHTEIATVDAMGLVKAIAPGEATITVKIGGKTKKLRLTVLSAVPTTEVKLSKAAISVSVGGSENLTAVVLPQEASQRVLWASADSAIAKVKDGVVTGVAIGTTKIIAISEDGMAQGECEVTVVASEVQKLESLPVMYIQRGKSIKLPAVFTPETVKNKNLFWQSDAPGIAKVDAAGKVTGVIAGTATITLTAKDGGAEARISVTVLNKATRLKKLTLSPKTVQMTVGQIMQLSPKMKPAIVPGVYPKYQSSAPQIASVDALGRVTANAPGTAKITVKVGSKSQKATVTVQAP